MPATIRHWISASPVMLAGIVTAAVTRPPRLVTKPLRAGVADVVLDHLVDGALDVAVLLGQLGLGGVRGGRQRARRRGWRGSSASRTNAWVSPGAASVTCGARCLPTLLLRLMRGILRALR